MSKGRAVTVWQVLGKVGLGQLGLSKGRAFRARIGLLLLGMDRAVRVEQG